MFVQDTRTRKPTIITWTLIGGDSVRLPTLNRVRDEIAIKTGWSFPGA